MKKVLLVDDEQYVLDDIERHMDWKQLEIGQVFRANSVKAALEIYRVYEPEIIISDIEMLEQSGLKLLEEVRKKNASAKFLFLTCHPDFTYARQALRLGIDDYLLKPVDYKELYVVVKRLLAELEHQKKQDMSELYGDVDYNLTVKAKEYIKEHLASVESVADVAEALHCSESALMKTFKKDTGWGVAEYIAKERIASAGQILKNTDWSISIISDMCGFKDQSYFSRVFKKLTNMTPNEYRRKHR